jgi:hypothetical protein
MTWPSPPGPCLSIANEPSAALRARPAAPGRSESVAYTLAPETGRPSSSLTVPRTAELAADASPLGADTGTGARRSREADAALAGRGSAAGVGTRGSSGAAHAASLCPASASHQSPAQSTTNPSHTAADFAMKSDGV